MIRSLLPLSAVALFLAAAPAASADDTLANALKQASAADSYAFTVEEKPGPGSGGGVEGKYQKGRPVFAKADKIEFFKQGEAVAYKEKDAWTRSRTGTLSDPLRVLGAVAKVRSLRLPHEEVAALANSAKAAKKSDAKEDGLTVYTAPLDAAAAQKLARSEHRSVARGGTAKFWVNADGKLVKYATAIKVQGRIGNAEIDGTVNKTVSLSGIGMTKVEVPAEAKKVLE